MQKVESRLTIIFVAFLFSSLVYMIVGFALSKSGWKSLLEQGTLDQILFGAFLLISISLFVLILKLKKGPRAESEKSLLSKYILLFALSEVPSILGLVLFLLTGKFIFLVTLCLVSIVAFFTVKPSSNEQGSTQIH